MARSSRDEFAPKPKAFSIATMSVKCPHTPKRLWYQQSITSITSITNNAEHMTVDERHPNTYHRGLILRDIGDPNLDLNLTSPHHLGP